MVFYKKVDVSGTKFQIAYFYHTVFNKQADFYQSVFQEAKFLDTIFKDETNFKFVLFNYPEKILFDVDLTKVSFLNSDIQE